MSLFAGFKELLLLLVLLSPAQAGSQNGLEPLYAVAASGPELMIQVKSTGCTKARDFRLVFQRSRENMLGVGAMRVKPDRCRAKPKRITLNLPVQKLLNENVYVLNPLRFD